MCSDIEDTWKMLLLMGIGVFASHNSIAYMEVMKELAQMQKLYLIIASSDYIYGTNYQFCHGYLSKDLQNMTQENCLVVEQEVLQKWKKIKSESSKSIQQVLPPEPPQSFWEDEYPDKSAGRDR